jgi:predicted O-linked N-acetylglucosamine transferase (SPINDLY family)
MLEVFEHHDKSRFEIQVFNIGERSNDAIQLKFIAHADRWTDLRGVGDDEAAQLIRAQGIDILIDMNGHTNYQRTKLLARHPAPILVNWLGYPGTMGSRRHHYLIADDFIVPQELERFYSERIVRLPCYQPNGKLFDVPVLNGTRAEFGLPETGVVFCCFNGAVKITAPVFGRWMRILAAVPGSVLWLRGSETDESAAVLRQSAQTLGIDASRLVFLSFRSNTEYLGCHRFADIFLDTFPYTAHTTASDSLRMGVPIVTLPGMSFASRVAGSLSRSAGLPDLICNDPESYVATAIRLGNDVEFRAAMRRKLADGLPGSALFDARRLVSALEGLFEGMWEEFATGRQPRPLAGHVDFHAVSPVSELDQISEFQSTSDYLSRLAGQ